MCGGEIAQAETEEGLYLRNKQRWGPLQGDGEGADLQGEKGEYSHSQSSRTERQDQQR